MILAMILRPETVFALLPAILFISYFYNKHYLKWSIVTILVYSAVTLFQSIPLKLIKDNSSVNNYEATTLINPTSYILKRLYPNGLPEDVDKDLGKYFKNEYLLIYQNDLEIDPYHNGGVNWSSTPDQYFQFRSQCLKIILSNPLLFIENRLNMTATTFNINNRWNFLGSIQNNDTDDFHQRVRVLSNITTRIRNNSALVYFQNIVDSKYSKSFILPTILLFTALLLTSSSGWFYKIFSILLLRTLIVILTAPASYTKYHYIIWLFAIFCFPCVIWELKTKPPSSLRTISCPPSS